MKIEFSWTSMIGLVRAILAVGTLLTLLFNPINILVSNIPESISLIQKINLFFIFSDNLVVAKLISIIILLLVVSGFCPFVTGVLHWYVTYSFFGACNLIDGGDHISSVLTFLLVPITLTDRRKNHWFLEKYELNTFRALIAKIFFTLTKIQMCVVYLHAFVGKIPVAEWLNGTATYYWLTHEYFGINEFFKPFRVFFLSSPFFVTIVTWGVLVFEFLLSSAVFIDNRRIKIKLFFFAVLFHLSILITHGLVTFFFAMLSGLIMYLLPNDMALRLFLKKACLCPKKLLQFL